MKDPYLLHIFNPTKNVSPFDVNMAYEAEFDGVIPYTSVTLEEIHALTQDTIFSRGPAGAKRTGIFIGGREFGLAMDMLSRARSAMVPPFEVSVFATNLTDEDTPIVPGPIGLILQDVEPTPRIIGVNFKAKY